MAPRLPQDEREKDVSGAMNDRHVMRRSSSYRCRVTYVERLSVKIRHVVITRDEVHGRKRWNSIRIPSNKKKLRQEFHSNTSSQPLPKINDDGLVWVVWLVLVPLVSLHEQLAPCKELHGSMWSCVGGTTIQPPCRMQELAWGYVILQRK